MTRRPPLDLRRAIVRVAFAGLVVAGAYPVATLYASPAVAALVAWDLAGVSLLAIYWSVIGRADEIETRTRAGSNDPGRTLVYFIVVLASATSLLGATTLAGHAHVNVPEGHAVVLALCLATVALAWAMTHTAFTLRYAHLYYRTDAEGVGGLTLPGDYAPTYFDFAYFAFTIGMCFQVSDITVTSRQIRNAVLLHAVISFAYNSIILAFVLTVVFAAS